MTEQKYHKVYEVYQQVVCHDGCNPMFWCSIRVLCFQASKLDPGNHVQLHATLGLKMYI
ncbi:hypothetical protein JVT61DRAFT_1453 [Boletus reticuloceps]|uniref:Uncharacterized protein n=1 Tax=Boletus reticuloceps TaxID=495285 RepID=A0A8I3A2A1_9AGAM|nr:hypothetical protein JVT61DRAFT_1453 [Boletus reticuloceps]